MAEGEIHVDLNEEQWATVKAALDGEIADLRTQRKEALDGLDIAEKAMRARSVLDYLYKHSWDARHLPAGTWAFWEAVAQQAQQGALAEWDTWKEERAP